MAWKIEIFPDANNPKLLDMQVLATGEDMKTASEVASWVDLHELILMHLMQTDADPCGTFEKLFPDLADAYVPKK